MRSCSASGLSMLVTPDNTDNSTAVHVKRVRRPPVPLVPKLRLGTQAEKLRFESNRRAGACFQDSKQSFSLWVPTRSLGTRGGVHGGRRFLVPKLRLGTQAEKLRFESNRRAGACFQDSKQRFSLPVPKRSLGTRGTRGLAPDPSSHCNQGTPPGVIRRRRGRTCRGRECRSGAGRRTGRRGGGSYGSRQNRG
jgi:hypothetical protein